MATVASLLVKLIADGSELTDGLNDGSSRLKRFSDNAVKASTAVVAGVGLVGAAMGAVGVASVKMAANMEQTEVAFTTLLGDAETAQEFLGDLSQFAAKTPFELPGLQRSSRQLLAFGFDAEDIIPIMTDVGDAISALGGGEAEISRVVSALGQMQAKGKTSREELLQIAELGIPVFDILQEQFQLTGEQLDKAISSGAIEVDKTIEALLGGMEGRFAGSMDAQSKTINGAFSNIQDSVGQIMVQLGSEIIEAINLGPILEDVGAFLSEFLALIQEGGVANALRQMIPPEVQEGIVILAGAILGAMVPALIAMAGAAIAAVIPLLPFIAVGAALAAIAFLIAKNWDTLVQFFTVTIPEKFNELVAFISSLPERIVAFFTSLRDKIRNRFTEMVTTALTKGSEFVESFVNFIKELPGRVLAFIIEMNLKAFQKFTEIVQFAKDAGKRLIDGFLSFIKNIPGAVKNVFNNVTSFIKGLPGKLFAKAKSIGKSLWNGFKKGIGIGSPSLIERALFAIGDSAFDTVDMLNRSTTDFQRFGRNISMPIPAPVPTSGNIRMASASANGVGVAPVAADTTEAAAVGGITIQVENMNVREESDVRKVAQELFRLQQTRLRAQGGRI